MNRLFSRIAALAECLCAQIEMDGGPPVCFCGVVPGDAAAHYSGSCTDGSGMAWVRLITIYPASAVGVASIQVGNCGVSSGLDVELGIMRDFAEQDHRGRPPSSAQLLAATDQQIEDALTMQRAVACCGDDTFSSKDWIMGAYTPIGPLGNLVGGTMTVNMVA